jgi:hypothetical protein
MDAVLKDPKDHSFKLDVAFFERDQRRAAIDHAADRGTMAFAKSRHPEEMAEGVMGQELRPAKRIVKPAFANQPGATAEAPSRLAFRRPPRNSMS